MSRIIPVPTTRVGDFFVRQRLTSQVLADQLSLFRLQTQVSTGQRLQLPSDDAPAALRAINLQRLIDRKGQIQTNIQASMSYLASAENTLGLATKQLSDLRGAVVEVSGTLATDTERQAVIQQLDRTLQFLVNTANTESQGRYLFAGSRSLTQPYEYKDGLVEYRGNEGTLRTYVDVESLFEMNVPGTEVFGGISSQVIGSIDLDPQLNPTTRLSTIKGGTGISPNAAISLTTTTGTATTTRIVDLSGAATLGDVARMIEAAAPPGAIVNVEVTGKGLHISAPTSNIKITEVAEGTTAKELGIFTGAAGPPANVVVGGDLDPALTQTTKIADLLGTKAQGRLVTDNSNNDLVLRATANGAEYNGVTVQFVAGVTAGHEVATYDAGTQTLTVQIQPNVSTAAQVAAAITAEGTFEARTDYRDALSTVQQGTNTVGIATFTAATSGGSGESLDTESGLIVRNGAMSVTVDLHDVETIEDLLNRFNRLGGLQAEINATSNGIDIRSRLSGGDLTIGENGGTTATQLGIRTHTGVTRLADFNRGIGVPPSDTGGNEFSITARNGVVLDIDWSEESLPDASVQDIIDLINHHPANTGATSVTARLTTVGNGIELVDSSSGATGPLRISAVEGSRAAEYLGFLQAGQSEVAASIPDGDGNYSIVSDDRHALETESVFNTLLRLRSALADGDVAEIGRSLERIDIDLDRLNFARAEMGSRMQDLDVIQVRLDDENVRLQSALSDDLDVDLVEAISNLTARQYAYEASLRTAGSLMQLSLLNFI